MGAEVESAEIEGLVKNCRCGLNRPSEYRTQRSVCVMDENPSRALNPLENVEELVRDANHLVQAALIMRYPETDTDPEALTCS